MIAAAFVMFKSVVYQCNHCTPQIKEKRGCISPAENKVWFITGCYKCSGVDSDCPECHGTGSIDVYECPRKLSKKRWVYALLPALRLYIDKGIYPDGRGILYQPIKLTNIFSIFALHYHRYEPKPVSLQDS